MHPSDSLPPETAEPESLTAQAVDALTRLRNDRALVAIIILTLIVNLGLFAFLVLRYDSLPDPLPLHYDTLGLPDRIDARERIFDLPEIGLIVFGLNAALGLFLYRHERAVSILLAGSALFVQLLMWLATVNIAGGFF